MNARKIGWTVFSTILLAGILVLYFLFEPLIVYNFGWNPLPPRNEAPSSFEMEKAGWEGPAADAEAALRAAFLDGDYPAITAAIGGAEGLIWRGAIGQADVAANRAVTFDDAFRIGSSSKAVTALAVGALIDEGVLRLDESLSEIDPTLPSAFDAMTLGHVMSHRGGVRNYGMCFCFPAWEFLNRRKFESVREAVGVIENDPLLFQPGADFQYTSLGYNLAGLAVATASGDSFPKALDRLVARPLGMTRTRAEGAPASDPSTVVFYDIETRGYKETYRVDNSIKWPSGGLLSTPTDMARLGAAMLDDRLLTEETRTALLTVPPAENGSKIYAHGWRVSDWTLPDGGTSLAWHHHGTAAGSRSVFLVLPNEELVVSVMTNKGGDSADDLAEIAGRIALPFINAR